MSKLKMFNKFSLIPRYKMLANEIDYQESLMQKDPEKWIYYAGVIEALENGGKNYNIILDKIHEAKLNVRELAEDDELFKEELLYQKGIIRGSMRAVEIDQYLYNQTDFTFDLFVYCENEMISDVINAAFACDNTFRNNDHPGIRYKVFYQLNELIEAISETEIGYRSVTVVFFDNEHPGIDTIELISGALHDNRALFIAPIENKLAYNADKLVHDIIKYHKSF